MTTITFEVRGVPVPQGSTRAYIANGHTVVTNKNPRLNQWREAVSSEARKVAPPALLGGALSVQCDFYFVPSKARAKAGRLMYIRPDLDKLLRAVLDACTGTLWHDDAQVQAVHGAKFFGDVPLCSVVVIQLPVKIDRNGG